MAEQGALGRSLRMLKIDFEPEHRQPSVRRLVAATVVAICGSLTADALLVAIDEAIFPSTRHYVHFEFSDYGKLTGIGVLVACIAWPIVARISSSPRWLFFRLAILVTLVLWTPDLYLFYRGQPLRAVAVLMLMHLAIAIITYNALVHISRVVAKRPDAGSRPTLSHVLLKS